MTKFKIKYKKDGCIGCGSCIMVCSRFLEMKGDNKADLVGSRFNAETKEWELELNEPACLKDAVDICELKLINIENNEDK